MMGQRQVNRPICGGTLGGIRPLHFDYWRVGYGQREGLKLDFWLEQAGEFHCRPPHYYAVPDYKIQQWTRVYYVTKGQGQVTVGRTAVHLSPGDLLITPTGQPFVYETAESHHYHWFALAGRWPSLWGDAARVQHWALGLDAELAATCVALRELLILQPPGYPLRAISYFYELMARVAVLKVVVGGETAVYPESIRSAMLFLEETATEPYDAATTANEVHLSQTHLRALFEKWVGESPQQFHTRCRIDRAKQLLRDQRLPVQVVAGQVGFNDVSYFSLTFKRLTGVSPSLFA
jgi:AraC-like DNA-binding protein